MAPLSGITLTRLELLAARLSSKVKEIVELKKPCILYHWTDSKIVLFWIKGSTNRWKQFVANQVKEISNLTDPKSWYHYAGKKNHTDLLSRGINADCLVTSDSSKWTYAEFLKDPKISRNFLPSDSELDNLLEMKERLSFEKSS